MDFFIDVIVPLAVPNAFTYCVTLEEFNFIVPGVRIAVPFGKRTVYTGVVLGKHQVKPQLYDPKDIFAIIDEKPIVTSKQIAFWQWISSYYMCTLGEVYRAALPSAFLLESETLLTFNKKHSIDKDLLIDEEYLLVEAFQNQPVLRLDEVRDILNKKNVFGVIDGLLAKKIVFLNEHLQETYKPKLTKNVRLNEVFQDENELQKLLKIGRAHV